MPVEREDGWGGLSSITVRLGHVGVQRMTQRAGKLGGSLQIFKDPTASADRSAARVGSTRCRSDEPKSAMGGGRR